MRYRTTAYRQKAYRARGVTHQAPPAPNHTATLTAATPTPGAKIHDDKWGQLT
jgi:hypothetical protein